MTDDQSRLLASYLEQVEVACPSCAYSLRGLKTDRCPECNQRLSLEVRLAEPKMGVFLAGLVAIGMALGFCGFVLVWGLVEVVPRRDLMRLAIGVLVNACLLAMWLRVRRRLGRVSPAWRWGLFAGAVALSFVCPAWFVATVGR
jgi:hypothetical protein